MFALSIALFLFVSSIIAPSWAHAATLTVCSSGCTHTTIQAAHDAGAAGDTIRVAAGTYNETLITITKRITIEAERYDRTNPRNNTTLLNGAFHIEGDAMAWDQGVVVRGFHIVGNDPIRAKGASTYTIEYSFLEAAGQNNDGISFESGTGGIARGNIIDEKSTGDDCIDIDGQGKDILIENNICIRPNQDGIEIRQYDANLSQRVTLTVRNNRFENTGQDGMQIMDYNNFTNRRYILERNLFIGAGSKADGAAIAIMAADVTTENFSAAPMPEPLYAINNTFLNGKAGISGGANLIAMNNIFSGNTLFDLKNVGGNSKIMNTLFATTAKLQGTNNLESATTKTGSPLLDVNFVPQSGSPAIDAGRASYQHTYTFSSQTVTDTITVAATDYRGSAPDLGWKEFGGAPPGTPPPPSPITTNPPASPTGGQPTTTTGSSCNRSLPTQFSCYGDWYTAFFAGGSAANGDFTGDGRASLSDFELWRRLFIDANTPTSPPGTPSPTTTIQPTATPPPSPPPTTTPGGPTPTTPPNQTRILFTPSSEDFPNPERGFMRQASIYLDNPLDPSKISAVQPSDSLVWIYFRLDNYRDPRDGVGVTVSNYQVKPLEPLGSGKGLDTVQAAFDEARKKGLKLVIRFIYNFGPNSASDPMKVNPDVPLDAALFHITQLKPVITNNADVIAAVQLGIVGHFGEWHSSKYLNDLNTRKQIVDAYLSAVSKDRMIMLRYPRYKQLFYGGPLTDANAYNQSDVARIGLYDDAFLRDDTDGGTFRSTVWGVKITNYCDNYPTGEIQCWRDYVSKDSLFVPVGGEAGTQGSTPSTFAQCPNALNQMGTMHFSFLHNGYSKVVLDHWVAQGCMPEIRRRLGYRLTLKEALIPSSIARGQTMNMQVVVRNEGFASMYNPRPVLAVLKSGTNRWDIPLPAVDPRRWEAGKDHVMTVSVPVPSTVAPGTYSLGLSLPDASASLKNTPAYAVRFANTGVWDGATGTNILTSNLVVN